MGEEEAIPHLASLTNDEDREVQFSSIHALGVIGNSAARSVLIKCTKSDDESMREMAEEALARMESHEESPNFRFKP